MVGGESGGLGGVSLSRTESGSRRDALHSARAKWLVIQWGVEVGFGSPVRYMMPLLWAYGPNPTFPTGPAFGGSPWGEAGGSEWPSQGSQRPDRIAQTGLVRPRRHHPLSSRRYTTHACRTCERARHHKGPMPVTPAGCGCHAVQADDDEAEAEAGPGTTHVYTDWM